MTIEYVSGDLLQDDSEALVNAVNCVGVMGRGIAWQFKNAWPANFAAYREACRRAQVQIGQMLVFETGNGDHPRLIINFPIRRNWKGYIFLEEIEAGLHALAEEIRARGIQSIALPPLGVTPDGLPWADVRPKIEEALGSLSDVRIRVYEPIEASK